MGTGCRVSPCAVEVLIACPLKGVGVTPGGTMKPGISYD
jgi:hypothetical protein